MYVSLAGCIMYGCFFTREIVFCSLFGHNKLLCLFEQCLRCLHMFWIYIDASFG